MKTWLWIAAILLFAYALYSQHLQLAVLLASLRQGVWYDIGLAALLQGLFFVNQAGFYASLSRLTDHPLALRSLVMPVLAANFLNVAVPSGTFTGILVIVEEARREGMTREEGVLISALYFLLDYAAFLVVLAVALVHLYFSHNLRRYEVVTAGALFAGVLVILAVLLLAVAYPEPVSSWLLRWGQKVRERLSRFRPFRAFTDARLRETVETMKRAILRLRERYRGLGLPVFHAFAGIAINLTTLWVLFLAFRYPVTFETLVAGYAMGTLFMIVSPTPSGAGWVEGTMSLTFASLGVKPEVGAIVTLVYRGITVWIPLVIGFAVFRRLGFLHDQPAGG